MADALRGDAPAAELEEPWIEDAPPSWLPLTATLVAIAGIGVSTYLTITHFYPSVLACSATGAINCEAVTTSAQSRFLGVPVAFLGLAWFVAMLALNLPPAWRSERAWVVPLRLAMVVGGMCFALYLISAELLIINAICIWCTCAHVLTFILFVLVGYGTSRVGLWRSAS